MYFADMYCYGQHNGIVGITGIVGCIGVIYVGQVSMYAVHIPDSGVEKNILAGMTFATWVKNQERRLGKRYGKLFVFANGTNRMSSRETDAKAGTEAEALGIKKALKSPPTTIYRIMRHLGPKSGSHDANSAAIMLHRVHVSDSNPSGCVIRYKQDFGQITWVDGGTKETGQYISKPYYCGTKRPSDIHALWQTASKENCKIATI